MSALEHPTHKLLITLTLGALLGSGCLSSEEESEALLDQEHALVLDAPTPLRFSSPMLERAFLAERAEALAGQSVILEFSREQVGGVAGVLRVHAELEEGRVVGIEAPRRFEQLGMVQLRLTDTTDLEALRALPGLVAIHEDERYRSHTTSALPFVNQPDILQRGVFGTGVGVAVLDTGVDFTHADFGGCAAAGAAGCRVVHAQDFAPDDGEADADGHGSNVAGIVARMAPGAHLIALDVFDGDTASSAHVLAALNWVLNNRQSKAISVVNMSFGGGYYTGTCGNSVFTSALNTLRQSGVIPVSSSGNDGFIDGMGAPACTPATVSVGAVYDRNVGGALYSSCADATSAADQVACFSNASNKLDILAPGVSVRAAGLGMTGTSQAAPMVSGALALLKESYPQESVNQLIARLTRAPKVTDARNGLSFPRLDLSASFDAIPVTPPPCTYTVSPTAPIAVDATAHQLTLSVTSSDVSCAWQASSSASWVQIASGGSGQGNGQVVLDISAQPAVVSRSTTVSVAGIGLTVTQEGRQMQREPLVVSGFAWLNWGRRFTPRRVVTLMTAAFSDRPLVETCVSFGEEACTAWEPFDFVSQVTLPDEEGAHQAKVWFRDDLGRESAMALEAEVTLDRQGPVDGEAMMRVGRDGKVRLTWDMAQDALGEVTHYRIIGKRGSAPRSCERTVTDRIFWVTRSPSVVRLDAAQLLGYGVRVCAYDEAGNASQGSVPVATWR